MKQRLLLTIIALFLFPSVAFGESVKAFVDKNAVSVGESLTLSVVVEGGSGEPDISALKDFSVVSSGSATNMSIINGTVTRRNTHNYILMPKREGKLLIPPLAVSVGREKLLTNAVRINVSARSAGSAGDGQSQNIFVTAGISDESPFEGEQIVYTFKLFTRYRFANAKLQKPDFKGFVVKELDKNDSYARVVNGMEYSVTEVTYILFPMETGEITIGSSVLTCDLVRGRSRSRTNSLFDDSFFGTRNLERRVFQSKPLTVTVAPLPAYTGEGDFSGIVGKVDLAVSMEADRLEEGDTTTLSITLTGTGNIMDAEAPHVPVPSSFKVYSDNPEEKISIGKGGYAGDKTFRLALVPMEAGDHGVGPVRINYFDPAEGGYRIKSAGPFSMKILPSSKKEELVVSGPPREPRKSLSRGKEVELTGRDILGVKDDMDALTTMRPMGVIPFLIFILLPPLAYIVARFSLSLAGRKESTASIMEKRALGALKEAGGKGASDTDVLSSLHTALICAVLSRAGRAGESLTGAEAREILVSTGLGEEEGKDVADLLMEIESARYGGSVTDTGRDILEKTRNALRRILK